LGELKGGIDPAGADEHWKTANSALNRIRTSFDKKKLKPQTFFVGAAIENAMAVEIFKLLKSGTMSNAANLTSDKQLTSVCDWIINL
jgi:type II restriction enzyme